MARVNSRTSRGTLALFQIGKGALLGPPFLFGAGTTIRTRDLLITNQLLYQLSYAGCSGALAGAGGELLAFRRGLTRA